MMEENECGEYMKDKMIKAFKGLWEVIKNYIKKKWWYLLLVIASSIYVIRYRYEIYEIEQFNAGSLIFIIWIILLALPLFSEIEIGSVKIKKEVEKAQSELKDSINELRMQIINMQISNANNNTIMVGQLASEGELTAMRKSVEENQQNNRHEDADQEEKVPDQTVYLLGIRRTLERMLSSLCKMINMPGRKTVGEMLYVAVKYELIDVNTANILREINGIANRSIHGEIVSDEYIEFVKEVFPEIKRRLENANEKFTENYWFTCTRCHYSGPSKYENACPKCGFVTDGD